MDAMRCPLAHGANLNRRCAWCGDPLPARRRRWCTDACGRVYADNHTWTAARQAALDRDGYRCVECGSGLDLHVHHAVPVGPHGYGPGCHHHVDGLTTFCAAHHRDEHAWARQVQSILTWADGQPARQLVLPGIAA